MRHPGRMVSAGSTPSAAWLQVGVESRSGPINVLAALVVKVSQWTVEDTNANVGEIRQVMPERLPDLIVGHGAQAIRLHPKVAVNNRIAFRV